MPTGRRRSSTRPAAPTAARGPRARRACARPSVEMLDALAHLVRRPAPRASSSRAGAPASRPATVLRFAEAAGWPVLADPLSNLRVPGTDRDLRPAAARRRLRRRAPPRRRAARRRAADQQGRDAVARRRRRPGARRSRRRLARPAARGERPDASPIAELLLGALADAVDVDRSTTTWLDALARRRRAGARRDRRAARRLGRAVRGSDRARRRRRGARRRDARRRVEHAGARRRELRRAARRACTFHANRGVNGIDGFVSTVLGVAAGADGADGRAARRPLLPARQQRPARRGATAASTPRSSWSTTTAAGSSRSCPRPTLPEHFEPLFGTPQAVDLAALAAVHGVPVAEVDARPTRSCPRCESRSTAGGVRVVLVRTDRAAQRRPPPRGLGRGRGRIAR